MKTRARIAVLAAGAVVVTGGLSAAALAQGGVFDADTTIERASDSTDPSGSSAGGSSAGGNEAGSSEQRDERPANDARSGKDDGGKGDQADAGAEQEQQAKPKGSDDDGKAGILGYEDSIARPGTRFESGDMLKSPDGSYVMGQQPDGDFVLRDAHGQRLWSTQTHDHPGAYTDFLGDGNLVTYSEDGEPLFTSETKDSGAAALAVQDDGNIVIYDRDDQPVWSSQEQAMKLRSGQRLNANQSRTSINGEYQFLQQEDGNLVMRRTDSGKVLWNSGTVGNPGAYTQMMPNGNLVTYDKAGNSLFFTATGGHNGAELHVNNDGNAGIRAVDGGSPWGTATTYDRILPNQELRAGQDRRADGYRLVQGKDGNLVLYTDGGKSIWSTGTKGHPGARTVLHKGNLMVVDQNDNALWATDTAGKAVDSLVVQDDGNLVLYGPGNKVVWSSNTES